MMSLGLCSQRQRAHLVVVDDLGVRAHVVRDHVVRAPRVVDAEPVREVPAVGELHGHHRVAGLEQREEHREVGRRAGVRLHVGVLGAEDLLAAVDGELLDLVDHVAAAVVARARQPLGVLVGEHRAGGLEHGAAGEVLAGDELQRLLLAVELAAQQLVELRVEMVERLAPPLAADGAQADSSSSRSATRCSCRPPSNGRLQPDLGDRPGLVLAQEAAAEAQHVAVVVAAGHLRVVGREAVGGAHALVAVGRHADADTGAADQHAALDLARRDQLGDLVAVHRVVHRDLFGVGADVDDFVPEGAQTTHDGLFESEPTVVGTGGDLHDELLLVRTANGRARRRCGRPLRARPRPGSRPRLQVVDCISPCAAGPFGPAPAH